MKFGKYLEGQTVPEWQGKYVDYKGIRKSLKKFKSEIESLNIHISELKAYNLQNRDNITTLNSKQGSPSTAVLNQHHHQHQHHNNNNNNNKNETHLLRNSVSMSKIIISNPQTPMGSSTPMPSDQLTAINTSNTILESMGSLKEIQDRLVKSIIDEVNKVNEFYLQREKEAQERFDKLKIQVPLYLKSKEQQAKLEREKLKDQDEQLQYLESYSKKKKKKDDNEKDEEMNNGASKSNSNDKDQIVYKINQHHAILNLTPIKQSSSSSSNNNNNNNGINSGGGINNNSSNKKKNKKEVKLSLLSEAEEEEYDDDDDDEDEHQHDDDDDNDHIEMATVYEYDEDMMEEVLDINSPNSIGNESDQNNGADNIIDDNQLSNSTNDGNNTINKLTHEIKYRLKEFGSQIKPATLLQPIGDRAKRYLSIGKQKSDEALLKEAFREYYHFLILLKNYQVINFTGFVKIVKKAEKNTGLSVGPQVMAHIEVSNFKTSKRIERLSSSIEKIHSELFNNGKIRDARKQLRNSEKVSNPTTSSFFTGICTGWTSAILVLIYYFIYTKEFEEFVRFSAMYNLYSAMGLVLLWAFVFGINVFIWTKAHVHYSFIFELSKNKFNYNKIFQAVTLLSVLWITSIGVYMWQSVSDSFPFPFVPPEYNPLVLFIIYFLILICPFNIFQLSVRKWFLNTVFRVVTTPLKSVKFKDFFMGDQLSSLVLMMVQFAQFICFYSVDAYHSEKNAVCSSKAKYINPFISALPAYWRLVQCFRRYYDSRDFVHLRNALKYSLSIVVVICSTIDGFYSDKGWHSPWRIIWVCAGFSNSLYSYWWDIFMDWSICVRSKSNPYNPFKWTLRKRRMYQPTFVYYIAIFSNLGFRLTWTFTKSLPQLTKLLPSYKLVVVIGIIEIIRRGQWNIYRLENEHLNNCGKFRVTREIPLPYHDEIEDK